VLTEPQRVLIDRLWLAAFGERPVAYMPARQMILLLARSLPAGVSGGEGPDRAGDGAPTP